MTCLYKFNPKLKDKKRKSCYAYKKKNVKKNVFCLTFIFLNTRSRVEIWNINNHYN